MSSFQLSNPGVELQYSPYCQSALDQTSDYHANTDSNEGLDRQRARAFSCPEPICSAQFFCKYTLREHLKRHTDEKPFMCDFESCGRRFSTSGNMTRHRRLHTLKQCECPAKGCTRMYTKQEKLMKHYRIHLGSAAYLCSVPGCTKSFATAGNLTRHTRKHDSSMYSPGCASSSSDEAASPTPRTTNIQSSRNLMLGNLRRTNPPTRGCRQMCHPAPRPMESRPKISKRCYNICSWMASLRRKRQHCSTMPSVVRLQARAFLAQRQ